MLIQPFLNFHIILKLIPVPFVFFIEFQNRFIIQGHKYHHYHLFALIHQNCSQFIPFTPSTSISLKIFYIILLHFLISKEYHQEIILHKIHHKVIIILIIPLNHPIYLIVSYFSCIINIINIINITTIITINIIINATIIALAISFITIIAIVNTFSILKIVKIEQIIVICILSIVKCLTLTN